MASQFSFVTDEKLKKKALEKAKKEGVTLRTVLVYSMKAYVDDKIHFGIMPQDEPEVEEIFFDDPEIQEKAEKIAKRLKK